jgi:hypothetical protein
MDEEWEFFLDGVRYLAREGVVGLDRFLSLGSDLSDV